MHIFNAGFLIIPRIIWPIGLLLAIMALVSLLKKGSSAKLRLMQYGLINQQIADFIGQGKYYHSVCKCIGNVRNKYMNVG